MTDERIIMIDDPEAAHRHVMVGWLARGGIFYKDEADARFAGCTHRPCGQCGAPMRKHYTKCDACRLKIEIAQYEAMPIGEWDGEAMLYSEDRDQYYWSLSEAEEDLNEGESLADLRLIICEPNYCRTIDEDFHCDEMFEDGELPHVVADAVEQYNEAVRGIVMSWSPGKFRLGMTEGDASCP